MHFVLTEGLQRRLRSRVAFPAMTQEKKSEIAKAHADDLERLAVAAVMDGTLDHRITELKLKAGNKWQTSAQCQKELEKVRLSEEEKALIEAIAIRDPFPGASTMKDTINKWYSQKKAGTKFNIEAYYKRLEENSEDVIAKQPAYLPAFNAQAQGGELADLLAKQLSQLSVEDQQALLQSVLERSTKLK